MQCKFYDTTTLYLSFDGDGLKNANETEKQEIEAYIMKATTIGKNILGKNGEEIEIFERSSVFGGVAKGRIKNATTGQGYTGWLSYKESTTEESGKRNDIYEEAELRTKDGEIITSIDTMNSCNILGGIVPVYFDGQKKVYVQQSLDKDGHVVVVDFQCSGKDGKRETMLPNAITIPREGNVFIMWVSGQPRFFKKEIQANGFLEEIEKNGVRVSGNIHFPSCIDEIDPISGKLIYHKPDSVSQRLENILTGNRTF